MKFPTLNRGRGQEITEEILTPILNRLVGIVEKRYNCRLDYWPFESFKADSALQTLASGRQPMRLNGKLFFPIFLKENLAGLASITESTRLNDREVGDLNDVIRLVLESTLMTSTSIEALQALEDKIRQSELGNKVVTLNQYRRLREDQQKPRLLQAQDTALQFNLPCLIEGQSHFDIHKMALEIHERSGRYAFLSATIVDPSVYKNVEAFNGLGPCTLFIPDLSEWNAERNQDLYSLLCQRPRAGSPQFITGSVVSKESLIREHGIARELIDKLSLIHLRMTESFESYVERGVMNFLFHSFTHHK